MESALIGLPAIIFVVAYLMSGRGRTEPFIQELIDRQGIYNTP